MSLINCKINLTNHELLETGIEENRDNVSALLLSLSLMRIIVAFDKVPYYGLIPHFEVESLLRFNLFLLYFFDVF